MNGNANKETISDCCINKMCGAVCDEVKYKQNINEIAVEFDKEIHNTIE